MTRGAAALAFVLVLPGLAVPGLHAAPAQHASRRDSHRSRLFDPLDLGLLEGPDRDQWQKPDQIMDALKIGDGSIVADLGAGGGWFTQRLARRVGPNGRVYAEDIQPVMIDTIKRRLQRENLANVQTILGTANDPKLPRDLDAVLIVDAYHEIEDPVALLRNVRAAINPQGCIGIVDFMPGGGGPGPAPDQRVAPETITKAAESAGLQLLGQETIPPFSYLLMFGSGPTARCAR